MDSSDLTWRKSSRSTAEGACVEVAELSGGGRAVRDSKNPTGPMLRFTASEWDVFLDGAKNGAFVWQHAYETCLRK
ncbi:DUF397 domain-containing protein [Sphaerisporangium sp. NPDC088356]|uniref:DUF397 domain-containing protein n=1 Tax=Sphaerisporangium sp. NPDC088356 TaxID=3154871 RepID=UPI00342C0618